MEKKENSEFKIAIVGLGYVGMPLAVAFSEQFPVSHQFPFYTVQSSGCLHQNR